jgi:hypothetical protein
MIGGLTVAGIDQAEETAPVRRFAAGAFQPARHWMALPDWSGAP